MELQKTHKEILRLCADDDTGLWLIIKRVSKDTYSFASIPEWARRKTLDVIRDLLDSQLIEAGNPNGPEFQPLFSSASETIAYIEREWDELGRTPTIGDICWFRATPAGEQVAHELNLT